MHGVLSRPVPGLSHWTSPRARHQQLLQRAPAGSAAPTSARLFCAAALPPLLRRHAAASAGSARPRAPLAGSPRAVGSTGSTGGWRRPSRDGEDGDAGEGPGGLKGPVNPLEAIKQERGLQSNRLKPEVRERVERAVEQLR
jgi:hypothetical protein